jgi:DNA replication licensing factor MCM4
LFIKSCLDKKGLISSVEVTGIYKAMPIRSNPKFRSTRSIFKTYIDVLHVMSTEKKIVNGRTYGDLGGEHRQVEQQLNDRLDKFSPDLQRKIQEIAAMPDVFDYLAASLGTSY